MPNTLDKSYVEKGIYRPGIFNGKVAFVTGGAGTICRVQTEALVLLGANAVILGRNIEKTEAAAREIEQLRPGARVIGLGGVDVRDVENLKRAVDRTVRELGKIDFVIAGAAGNFLSPIGSLSARAFKTVVEIDLVGSYNTLKATMDQLIQNKGSIIFVSATLHYAGLPMQVHASAAKAGVDSLARTAAVELGPFGVRSNIVAPGPIAGTEGMDRLLPAEMLERSIELVPLQRWGTTQDIADGTVYLFSDAAGFVTGATLVIDGGDWQTANAGSEKSYPHLIKAMNSNENKL
jgi:peroxisomal 2,4-dienoyl-CoA reductase